jgi:hypothetical protein
MNDHYVVLDENDKVVGFNLTAKEKDEIFYTIDTGDGHKRSPKGWAWTGIDFKAGSALEVENHLRVRGAYLTTTKDQWKDTATALYKQLNIAYEQLKKENGDGHLSHLIIQISSVLVNAERNNGIHFKEQPDNE